MDAVWQSNARSQLGMKVQSTGPDLPRTEVACTSKSIAASIASLWSDMGYELAADAWREVVLDEEEDSELRLVAQCGKAWKVCGTSQRWSCSFSPEFFALTAGGVGVVRHGTQSLI